MKIGVSSYSFSRYAKEHSADLFEICNLAKEIGFDGIEFTDLPESDDPLLFAKRIRAHCEKLDLPIVSYTVGADFLRGDEMIEVVERKVDIAEALGASVMRHDACYGYPAGTRDKNWLDAVREIAPRIRKVTEYARAKGIRTCTENHGYCIQDSERVESLIRAVGSDNYGWLVDIGNFACADENCAQAVSVAAPYAFHVHAKDFLWKSGQEIDPGEGWFGTRAGNYLRGTIVGHGFVPVAQCLRMLKKAGYDGYTSLEFEGLEENLSALKLGLAYLRRVTA